MNQASSLLANTTSQRPGSPAAASTKLKRLSSNRGLRLWVTLPACYGFTWGLVAFGVAALVALGVDFHEAETAMMLLGFLQFVPLFLWAFASRRQGRVWATLVGGAVAFPAAAWALQRGLLA